MAEIEATVEEFFAAAGRESEASSTGGAASVAQDPISAETWRAYRRALRQICDQLAGRPVDDSCLSQALAEMAANGATSTKLGQTASAVRFAARRCGRPDPVGLRCEAVLKTQRRTAGETRQAAAVDWGHADAAAAAVAASGTASGLRNAAIIAVMSDALLRVGEAAALQTDEVERRDDGSATLAVARSKTDQEGDGASLYLGAPTVVRVQEWLQAAEAAGADMSSGPLYRRIRRGEYVTDSPLSARSIREIVRQAAAAVGIEGASGHSLRVGSAISLVRAGASLPETQQAGRWASPRMPAHYARNEFAARGAVARLRYDAN